MSRKNILTEIGKAIIDGFSQDESDVNRALGALKDTPISYLDLIRESAVFLKNLTLNETPKDPEDIKNLERNELIFTTFRVNFFERLRLPVVDDEQLEHLLIRAHEIWGEHPSEPLGRWVDWCLWTHLQRRQKGISISELIAGEKTADDLKNEWISRHAEREERRKLQKVDNYSRYHTPEEVPASIRHILMSPYLEREEVTQVDSETNKVEDIDIPDNQ